MEKKAWPKASKELGERLATRLEKYHCEQRRMFGADVWFVNGNMFTGVFGDGLILRLTDEDITEIKKALPGTGIFAPNERMVMREYVFVPGTAIADLGLLDEWFERSYNYAKTIIPKKKGKK